MHKHTGYRPDHGLAHLLVGLLVVLFLYRGLSWRSEIAAELGDTRLIQTARAADLRKTVGVFRAWTLDSFGPEDVIRPGALVELETEGGPAFYLLAHVGGGVRVDWEGRAVSVVTPSSPIGSGIVGAEEGDDFQLVLGGQKKAFEIVGVW